MSKGKKNRTKKPEETKIVEEVRETAVLGEMEKPEDSEPENIIFYTLIQCQAKQFLQTGE